MCGKTAMRDREFDSSVRESIDVAAERTNDTNVTRTEPVSCAELHRQANNNLVAQRTQSGFMTGDFIDDNSASGAGQSVIVDDEVGAKQPDMLSGARDALRGVLNARTQDEGTAIADDYVNSILQPYYQGRGRFDHVTFLKDLQTAKGHKLSEDELRFFGQIVGSWTGTQAAEEYIAAMERGDREEARAIVEAVSNRR